MCSSDLIYGELIYAVMLGHSFDKVNPPEPAYLMFPNDTKNKSFLGLCAGVTDRDDPIAGIVKIEKLLVDDVKKIIDGKSKERGNEYIFSYFNSEEGRASRKEEDDKILEVLRRSNSGESSFFRIDQH